MWSEFVARRKRCRGGHKGELCRDITPLFAYLPLAMGTSDHEKLPNIGCHSLSLPHASLPPLSFIVPCLPAAPLIHFPMLPCRPLSRRLLPVFHPDVAPRQNGTTVSDVC